MINFKSLEYLQEGNTRQKLAYQEIQALNIFEDLKLYSPVLTGTIPIGIDLPESDLDIICEFKNPEDFITRLRDLYQDQPKFQISTADYYGVHSIIANFQAPHFEIEIFGQSLPVDQQNAYQHMCIEHAVLAQKGSDFKAEVMKLKAMGIKTEPAFAQLLALEGDPYLALLNFGIAAAFI